MADIDVRLNLKKADQVIRGIENINKTLAKVQKQTGLSKVNGDLKRLEQTTLKTSTVLSGAVGALTGLVGGFAALNVVRAVTSNFLEFEAALTEVKTILPDVAEGSEDLSDSLVRASSQFGTTAAAQAKSFYQIISAGIEDTTEANEVLIASNQLAIGGLTQTADAVRIITGALNVYGDEVGSASDVSDSLFQTVKLGVTRVEELASSLGLVLPVAKQAGVSFDEINAAVATLTKRSVPTSLAVTQIRSLLAAVAKNASRAEKVLGKDLAPAFSEAALRSKGLVGFLKDLQVATGGNTKTLFELIGRIEGVNAVLTLGTDNFIELSDIQDKFQNKAGATADAFNDVNATAGRQFKILGTNLLNATLSLAGALGDTLLPVVTQINEQFQLINAAAGGSQEAIREFNEAVRGTPQNISILSGADIGGARQETQVQVEAEFDATIESLLAVGEAAKTASVAQRDLAVATEESADTTQKAAEAQKKLQEENDKIAANLGKLVASLESPIDRVRSNVAQREDLLNEARQRDIINEREHQDRLVQINQRGNDEIFKIAKSGFNGIQDAIQVLLDQTASAAQQASATLGLTVQSFRAVAQGQAGAVKAVQGFFLTALEVAKSLIDEIKNIPIVGAFAGVVVELIDIFSQPIDEFERNINAFFEALPEILVNIIINALRSQELVKRGVRTLILGIIAALPDFFRAFFAALVEALNTQSFIELVVDIVRAFIDILPELFDAIVDGVVDLIVAVVKAAFLNSFFGIYFIIFNLFKDVIIRVIKIIFQAVVKWVKIIIKGAIDFVKKIIDGAKKFVKTIIDGVREGIQKVFDKLRLGGGGGGGGFRGAISRGPVGAVKSIGKKIGFQEGGIVPNIPGVPSTGDNVIAGLNPGELVIPRSDVSNFRNFLDEQRNQSDNEAAAFQAILDQLRARENQDTNLALTLQIGESQLAEVLLNLNRQGFRVA